MSCSRIPSCSTSPTTSSVLLLPSDIRVLSQEPWRRPQPVAARHQTSHAERMRSNFVGSALEREFAGPSFHMADSRDPASPLHHDVAAPGSRGGSRLRRGQ